MKPSAEWQVTVEHVTDAQAAADVARAFDLILGAADRQRAQDHGPVEATLAPDRPPGRGDAS